MEGRAASDEEEEDGRMREEAPIPEGKKQMGWLHSCAYQLHTSPSSDLRDSRGRCDLWGETLEHPGKSAAYKEKVGKRFAM